MYSILTITYCVKNFMAERKGIQEVTQDKVAGTFCQRYNIAHLSLLFRSFITDYSRVEPFSPPPFSLSYNAKWL